MSEKRVLNILEDLTTLQFAIIFQWTDLALANEKDIKSIQKLIEKVTNKVKEISEYRTNLYYYNYD